MAKIEINLPDFPGFYETQMSNYLDGMIGDDENNDLITEAEYDQINWPATFTELAKEYLHQYLRECGDVLKSAGISLDFVKIDSPQFYNFSTDKLVCKASFNKSKLLKYLKDNGLLEYGAIAQHMDQFTSCSGFASFYTNDPDEWVTLIKKQVDSDNVVFQLVLQLLTSNENLEWLESNVCEKYFELLQYES